VWRKCDGRHGGAPSHFAMSGNDFMLTVSAALEAAAVYRSCTAGERPVYAPKVLGIKSLHIKYIDFARGVRTPPPYT